MTSDSGSPANLSASPDTVITSPDTANTSAFDQAHNLVQALRGEIQKVLIGQQAVVDQVLMALIARGHVLIEGVPGLGKTLLVRTLALLLAEPAVSLIAWYELKDVRSTDAVIGDDHNRHLGVVTADYRPKPALDALTFVRRLFADGFRSIAGDAGYEQTSSPDVHVRSFLTANQRVVVVAWLSNAPASATAPVADDARLEQLRVVVPYLAQSEPILYDESGRKRTTGLVARSQSGTTELELTLGGGQVSVVEFPVAARR